MEDTQNWGVKLREARTAREWSLADLADRTGLSRAYISAIERGKSKRPGADVVRRLESALGISEIADDRPEPPVALRLVGREHGLTADEIEALAAIRIDGKQPQTKQRWDFIFRALLASEPLDNVPGVYTGNVKDAGD
jgi:transcriptional regulator with XRE-family HTH domain